jgi:lysozyme
MKISQKGIDLIKEFEGCRLDAYRCPANVPTIGYGSTGADVHMGMKITQEEAELRLKRDIAAFEECVSNSCTVEPSQNQFDAMVALCFNIGPGSVKHNRDGFLTSSVLRFHNEGRHNDAAIAFGKWIRGGGRILPGLMRRREAEAKLYSGKGA